MTQSLDQRLAEARLALHELVLGKRVVKVMVDGQSVEFTPATRADLVAYIADLEAAAAGLAPRRAISVVFG
jgi:hypothetical protein